MKNKANYILMLALFLCVKAYSQCLETTHTPFQEDSWLSCDIAPNPNPAHAAGHWVMYDLGFEYVLDSVHIWNLNTWTNSSAGVQEAVIDYSMDGVNWISLDTFTISQASASYKYAGVPGPNFEHTAARYVLVTALSNWGNPNCTGLSEIYFGVSETIVNNDPEPLFSNASMAVSPNPVVDVANISLQTDVLPESIGLYNVSGQLISEQHTIRSKNVRFDMKGLSGGIYVVKATLGDVLITEKVVKIER